jgi:hypothetical protein
LNEPPPKVKVKSERKVKEVKEMTLAEEAEHLRSKEERKKPKEKEARPKKHKPLIDIKTLT